MVAVPKVLVWDGLNVIEQEFRLAAVSPLIVFE